MNDSPTRGRAWATAGFLMGIAVSVGGNVAHTWHPAPAVLAQAGATAETWRPAIGAQVFAAVWPLALLVTVEVLARVQWPRTFGWALARYGGASLVAGVAAVMSYAHLHGLLRAYGEDDVTARIGPLSIDGLMIVCGFALLACSRAAATATVPAEGADGGVPVPGGVPGVPGGVPDVHSPVDGYALWDEIEPEPRDGVPDSGGDPEDTDAPGPVPGVPEGVPGAPEGVPGVPEEVIRQAAEVFAADLAAGRVPGVRAIKARLRVGQPRAQRVQAYLAGCAGT